MPEYVIIDHHHDQFNDHYRLTVGVRELITVADLDEEGNHRTELQKVVTPKPKGFDGETGQPVADRGGDVIWEDVEEEHELPVLTQQEVVTPVEDFIFAAFDPRWEGKTPEEVAEEQRRLVKAALRKRERGEAAPVGPPADRVSTLPGVGEAL